VPDLDVAPDLSVSPSGQATTGGEANDAAADTGDIWRDHPAPLKSYEADNDLPPGTGGALVPDQAPGAPAERGLPEWRKKLKGFLSSPKFIVPALGAGALATGIGLGIMNRHPQPAPQAQQPAYTAPMTTQDVNEGLSDISSRMPPSQVGTADRVERVNPARVAPPVHKPSPADWMRQYDKY
jgi:hypothetical protein